MKKSFSIINTFSKRGINLMIITHNTVFNPLSANVVHFRHDPDVACSGYSALYRQIY